MNVMNLHMNKARAIIIYVKGIGVDQDISRALVLPVVKWWDSIRRDGRSGLSPSLFRNFISL